MKMAVNALLAITPARKKKEIGKVAVQAAKLNAKFATMNKTENYHLIRRPNVNA